MITNLLQLLRIESKTSSYSVLVDFQQIYVRNIILFCVSLSMARILFGENIICQVTERSVTQNFVDTKCYINGTMTRTTEDVIYHDYYQWISVYLLLLAFGFYFPFLLWYTAFGKYLRQLENFPGKPDEAIQVIKDSKGNYMFLKIWGLEFIYMVYLASVLMVTDVFFNGLWSQFQWTWNTIYKIFPDYGSCFVTYFQSSGTTDGRFNCLLPLCSIYRKVFMTLYGLTLFLVLFNVVVLIYRIKFLWHKKRKINVWWAFMIAKRSATSWNDQKKLDVALKKIMQNSDETILLNVVP